MAAPVDRTKPDSPAKNVCSDSQLLSSLLKETPDFIYFKDLDCNFIKGSKALCDHLNLNEQNELIGKSDFDFFEDKAAIEKRSQEQEVMKSGIPIYSLEEKSTQHNGKLDWVLTSKTPLKDAHGNIVGVQGISKDITIYKKSQLELEKAQEKLIDLSRHIGRSEIASSILHNIGNVLNSINLSSTTIEENLKESTLPIVGKISEALDKPPQELSDFLIKDSKGNQIPALLNRVFDSLQAERSQIQEEAINLNKCLDHVNTIIAAQQQITRSETLDTPTSINEIIDTAISVNMAGIQRHSGKVFKNIPENLTLVLDKHRLLQVLINLISNGKYSADSVSVKDPTIWIDAKFQAGQLIIEVKDNGIGISKESIDRIFEYGYTERKEGNGIGLHSSVIAIEEMKGTLTVHSDGPNKGATFTVAIPIIS